MEQSKCCLCTDSEASENSIVACGDCGLKVHVLCYGIENANENFKCSPCEEGASEPICKLCVQSGGALKKTNCGGWVHVLCGLFTDGCIFLDNNRMEPVDISCVSDSKRNKTCMFCKTNGGFSPLCSQAKCNNRFHISCAHKNGCLKEDDDRNGKIKFRAYCLDHKPKDSSRRISSEFVRGAVKKISDEKVEKRKKARKNAQEKSEKEKSSEMNTKWLTFPNASSPATSVKRKNECQSMATDTNVTGPPKKKFAEMTDTPSSLRWDSYDLKDWKEGNEPVSLLSDIFGDGDKENILHACYKDDKIDKLKGKNKKLKEKLRKLEDLNANLQQELLTSKLFLQMPSQRNVESNQDVIQALKNRIVPKLSDDETEFVYSNGVNILIKLMKQLDTIPGNPSSDRQYVNSSFTIFLPDKYINKKIKKFKKNGIDTSKMREEILKILRESNRHQTMKDLYEYRVYSDGAGDLQARVRLFKLTFRTKFNNWWTSNAVKSFL